MLKLLCQIWSLLPLFSLTRDSNYGLNNQKFDSGLRFSVINLRIGTKTVYLLTFTATEKHWKCVLDLASCQWAAEGERSLTEKDIYIKDLATAYVDKHLPKISEQEQAVEKEFLIYLQNNLAERKGLAYQKVNYYTAIILVLVPIAFTFVKSIVMDDIIGKSRLFVFCIALSALLFYSLANWCILALQYTSVSGLSKSGFSDLKKTPGNRLKAGQLLYSYYYDWQEERFDVNLRVAYVKNIELFVKYSLLLIFILISFQVAINLVNRPVALTQDNLPKNVYDFNIEKLGDPFSPDSVTLAELHTKIKKTRPDSLLIFLSEHTQASDVVTLNMNQYAEYLGVSIYVDDQLKPYEFKIAILGG